MAKPSVKIRAIRGYKLFAVNNEDFCLCIRL